MGVMRIRDGTDNVIRMLLAPLGTGSSGEKAERKHWAAGGLKRLGRGNDGRRSGQLQDLQPEADTILPSGSKPTRYFDKTDTGA